ncbi:DNA mismatch repair protein mlh1 [Thecamonas trahens ATCC 50062]|uniref:DNA mismatch repair protein mlh1 n=1 Tax=Thecamonas trahens ATCC 50062 TaxID=461836 RepID=A0A0L0DMK0_THETB|nr:DNA mismatch repair protein mlh1 [Thecamonas trahens ATCC 50062]KNC53251.1 DNA mismatch repair protein mlh1 [Thecamonas trahens ATCC 50062]|eukprot:XP_013754515.1 DNA mismatch repair protein mlh1 [Thecamonas trahens ATCC 50062]
MAAPIQALDKTVVDRIAAGEVIERPANALKELVENALDAGSSSISVVVKGGGLKVLQITDNGHGIRLDDFPLVCQRFATSKLTTFDDLKSIGTFGFRGEALASISHVAHVTITSKTPEAQCAFAGSFADGKLLGKAKPTAGNTGTTIKVEDLFYNVKTRRKALKSTSEEFNRVLDVLTRYALRNAGVAFSLKKFGDTRAVLNTQTGASVKDNIALLYGTELSRELLRIDVPAANEYGASVAGFVSNANYSSKKEVSVLFVNSRSVDVPSVRKAIKALFSEYLPKKAHPFVYLDIALPPETVDVNVHPTKKQVHFMHEDEIVSLITDAIRAALLDANASRTFYSQAVLPTFSQAAADVAPKQPAAAPASDLEALKPVSAGRVSSSSSKLAPQHMVRVDHRSQTMDAFVHKSQPEPPAVTSSGSTAPYAPTPAELIQPNVLFASPETTPEDARPTPPGTARAADPAPLSSSRRSGTLRRAPSPPPEESNQQPAPRKRRRSPSPPRPAARSARAPSPSPPKRAKTSAAQKAKAPAAPRAPASSNASGKRILAPPPSIVLMSVLSLCEEVMADEHAGLSAVFRRHKFVGCVDASYALVQHETKLYLLDLPKLSQALYYQLGLAGFGAFPRFVFSNKPKLADLVTIALDDRASGWSPDDGPKDVLALATADFLVSKAEMLEEYFGVVIDTDAAALVALPQLLPSVLPPMWAVPAFLLQLGNSVDWSAELPCFATFLTALAQLYAIKPEQHLDEAVMPGSQATLAWAIEHVLFPALRSSFSRRRALPPTVPFSRSLR